MKKIPAAIAALSLALVGVAVTAAPAMATHPQVSGVAICDTATGDNVITWTVSGDPGYPDVAGTFVSADRAADQIVGKTVTGGETITATERLQPDVRSVTLTVGIQFANHRQGDIVTNSGSVRLVSCEREIPTQPADFDAPYTATVGDCDTLEHVTTSGTVQHRFAFDTATWAWVETVTDVPDPVVTVPFTDDELAVCAGPQPEDKVTYTEWERTVVDCEAQTSTWTRSKTTVTSVRVGAVWVDGDPVTVEESKTEPVTAQDCPVVTPPVEEPPATTPPATVPPVTGTPAALVTTGSDVLWDLAPWGIAAAALGIILAVVAGLRERRLAKK